MAVYKVIPIERPEVKLKKDGSVIIVEKNKQNVGKNSIKNNGEKKQNLSNRQNKITSTQQINKGLTEKRVGKVEMDSLDKKNKKREQEELRKKKLEIQSKKKEEELEKKRIEEESERKKKEQEELEKKRIEQKDLEKKKKEQDLEKTKNEKEELQNKKMEQELKNSANQKDLNKKQENLELKNDTINNKNNNINNTDDFYYVAPITKVVKNNNYGNNSNNLSLINKIEQNLMYNSENLSSKAKLDIKKGEWTKDDLVETKTTKFEITRTSKKIEAESKEIEKNTKISNLRDLAYEAVKFKEYEIAVKLCKEILQLNKKDNFTKLSLATSYHMLGQYMQAKPLYIELLPVFPNSEQLVSNLLSIIIQESPYEAIYLLPSLAAKYNESATIQAQTSIAFSTVERYEDAIKYIQKAINLDEDNVEYKYNLAVLYDLTKKYEQAYALYKELYEIAKINGNLPYRTIGERLIKIKKYL